MFVIARIIENSVFIKFEFDKEMIEFIKLFSNRFWNAETKEWCIEFNDYQKLKLRFQNKYKFLETSEIKKPRIQTFNYDYEFDEKEFNLKTKLYDHQLEAINFGINNATSLNGSEQGCGKTLEATCVALWRKKYCNVKHCLILCCVSGNKYNWESEILKTTNEIPYIVGGKSQTTKCKINDLYNLPNNYFLITNIQTLVATYNKVQVIDVLKNLCDTNEIGMIIVDEAHKQIANPTNITSKCFKKLECPYKIAMSGTFIVNSPLDLYTSLFWTGYEKNNYYVFKNFYSVMGGFMCKQVVGHRNLQFLEQTLDKCMIRHLKKNVLNLPEKIYIDEYVEMNPKQLSLYKELCMSTYRNMQKIKRSANPLSMLVHLRQITGYSGIVSQTILESAKLDRMVELVEDIIKNNKKVVIFSIWIEIVVQAFKRLQKYKPLCIVGDIPQKIRQEIVDKFQNEDGYNIIIGTIGALGTGYTLNKASNVMFLDEPWNRATKDQAIDRCHRIGTSEPVNVISLVTKNTIDETVHKIVYNKGKYSDQILDNIEPQNQLELVNEIFEEEKTYENIK